MIYSRDCRENSSSENYCIILGIRAGRGNLFHSKDHFDIDDTIYGPYKIICLKLACTIWSSCSFIAMCAIPACRTLLFSVTTICIFVIRCAKTMVCHYKKHSRTSSSLEFVKYIFTILKFLKGTEYTVTSFYPNAQFSVCSRAMKVHQ